MSELKFVSMQDLGTFGTRVVNRYDRETKSYVEVKQDLKVQIGTWEDSTRKGKKREPKFDIRPWNEDGTADKGLSLTPEEAQGLYDLLKKTLEEE